MLIFSAASPVLTVEDVARSIAWYAEVLGFAADPFPARPPYSFAILTRDRAEVMLQRAREETPSRQPSSGVNPGWSIYLRLRGESLLDFAESVRSKTAIVRGPERMFYDHVEFEIADPDGHRICVSELLPPGVDVPNAREA